MRLAAFPVTGMAGMLMGFVDHSQTLWRESLGQLFCDDVRNGHDVRRAVAL
jgi:hypothetical protein